MKKTKPQRDKSRRYLSWHVFYQDPKQLKQIERVLIEPLRKAFATGRLIWPVANGPAKQNERSK